MTEPDAHSQTTGGAYIEQYSDAELDLIVEQGMIYMCACPAQVADAVRKLRALIRYQRRCAADPANDTAVHATIARSTIESHAIMEECLNTVIALEQWDRSTLQMPAGLRKRQMQELRADGNLS